MALMAHQNQLILLFLLPQTVDLDHSSCRLDKNSVCQSSDDEEWEDITKYSNVRNLKLIGKIRQNMKKIGKKSK